MKHSRIILAIIFIFNICFSAAVFAAETTINIGNSQWNGNTISYTVSTDSAVSGTMICALYDENNVVVGIGTDSGTNAKTEWNVSVRTGAEKGTAKVMLWDSLNGMRPIADAVTDNSEWVNPQPGPIDTPTPTPEPQDKVLVVYYSATNTTERIANMIADYTDATVFELEPKEPYTSADLNYSNQNSRVVREHNDPNRHVELVSTTVEDFDSYGTVFIGYPIWWYEASWVIDDFVKNNDFTGKTVIPFCTSASSPLGDSGDKLAAMAGTGNWIEGRRFSSGTSEANVQSWIDSLK